MPNVFPDIYPAVWEPDFDPYQERDEARDGYLQINSYDPVDQLSAHAEWTLLSRAQRQQIKAHRDANKDVFFSLFDFWFDTVTGLFVATADGVSTVYTLPAKAVAGQTIKHNAVTAGTQPTLLAGTGTDGKDQILYTSGTKPGAGVTITFDATDARLWYEVFYRSAKYPPRHRDADIWGLSFDFIQKVIA